MPPRPTAWTPQLQAQLQATQGQFAQMQQQEQERMASQENTPKRRNVVYDFGENPWSLLPWDPYNKNTGYDPLDQPLPQSHEDDPETKDPNGRSLADRLREMQEALQRSENETSKRDIEQAKALKTAQLRQKFAIQNSMASKGHPHGPPPTMRPPPHNKPPPSRVPISMPTAAAKREREESDHTMVPAAAPPPPPPSLQHKPLPSRVPISMPTAAAIREREESHHKVVPPPPQSHAPLQTLRSDNDILSRLTRSKANPHPTLLPKTESQLSAMSNSGAQNSQEKVPQSIISTHPPPHQAAPLPLATTKLKLDTTFTPESIWHPFRDALLRSTTSTLCVVCLVTTTGTSFSFPQKKEKVLGDGGKPSISPGLVSHILIGCPSLCDQVCVVGTTSEAWECVRFIVESQHVKVITFHASSLYLPLFALFGTSAVSICDVDDIRLMNWMLDPADSSANFDHVCLQHGFEVPPNDCATLEGCLARIVPLYSLYHKMFPLLKQADLWNSYEKVERVVAPILSAMKLDGLCIDVQKLSENTAQIRSDTNALEQRAHALAGEEFNLSSTQQLSRILFEVLNLPLHLGGNTKTGKPSVNEDTLKALATHHELPAVILQHRHKKKVLSTYVDGLMSHLYGPIEEGSPIQRLHPNYIQESVDTGRLSSNSPNVQNFPRVNESDSVIVRKSVVAPPGTLFIALDYAQIELRLVAHFTRDAKLLEVFRSKEDIFVSIAAMLLKKDVQSVAKEERNVGKTCCYALLYGGGVGVLAKNADIDAEYAAKIVEKFHATFTGYKDFRNHVIASCRSQGSVRTWMNRWRKLPDITSNNAERRSAAERQAVNTIIQGSAADIAKIAMIHCIGHIRRHYPPDKVRLLCQIHDELIFSVEDGGRDQVAGIAKDLAVVMEKAAQCRVPLVVKASVGPSLGELEEI